MEIELEYGGAALGDARLSARLQQIAKALRAKPDIGFPQAMSQAELEAFYRFVGNDSDEVGPQAILAPHIASTRKRCAAAKVALIAHDTTEFGYSSPREGMGRVTDSGTGFFAHYSLAMASTGERQPLGVLDLRTYVRKGKSRRKITQHSEKRPARERESFRWQQSIDAAQAALEPGTQAVHLMDREADSYALFGHMVSHHIRFVSRIRSNRLLDDEGLKLFEHMQQLPGRITREVPLAARTRQSSGGSRKVHPLRHARAATLSIAAGKVTLRRPATAHNTDAPLPDELELNVIHVREESPPAGTQAIDWKLITTEPIQSLGDIEAAVDFYRARWLIEEFFKALKTGCAMEKRQLESLDAMLNALAIFTPIAVELLTLRYLAQQASATQAGHVLNPLQLKILTSKVNLRANPTVLDAMLAVARLGGHLKRNGPPGWMVLGRGYIELLSLEEGARIAIEAFGLTSKDVINP